MAALDESIGHLQAFVDIDGAPFLAFAIWAGALQWFDPHDYGGDAAELERAAAEWFTARACPRWVERELRQVGAKASAAAKRTFRQRVEKLVLVQD